MRGASVSIIRIFCALILTGSLLSVAADFSSDPQLRSRQADAARARSHFEREAAKAWAQSRGMNMRYEGDRQTIELVAYRNGIPIFLTTRNVDAAVSLGTDLVRNSLPFAVNGSGWTAGIWDGGGVRASHQEFGGRVTIRDGAAYGDHASHVGGTFAAAGVDPMAKGMAPNISIDSYEWTDDIAEMLAVGAASPLESNKLYVSNHSYGTIGGWSYLPSGNTWSGKSGWHWPPWAEWSGSAVDTRFGQYDAGATNYDHVVSMAPYFLPFVSAGNDRSDNPSNGESVHYYKRNGPIAGNWRSETFGSEQHPAGDGMYKNGFDNISAEATAKNIMTVGAVADAVSGSSRSVNNAAMLSFSSWGPADDGRIKPDIVANGYELYSVQADSDTAYAQTYWSGTSMAAPGASGSAMLLVDYYEDRFPGQVMRASTLKGLIIHTADDLGRPGPDYESGWGLMNTLEAASLIRDYADGNQARMTEARLSSTTNTSDSYSFFVDGHEPFRVTICWTDPPGTEQVGHDVRTAALVNDLDLLITGPDGVHHPYRLDFSDPTSNALTDAENNIDNVEQVYIGQPIPGSYTISVDYDGVLSGGQQWYSMLISGVAIDGDADLLPDYWELEYFSNPTAAVASADFDGDGLDNLSEYISGHDPTNAASVFAIESYDHGPTGGVPYIVRWTAVEGRVYNVKLSSDLLADPFADNESLSGDMPYPANSFTDFVERVSAPIFYQVEVRLAD